MEIHQIFENMRDFMPLLLLAVAVDPRSQRRGYGKALVRHAFAHYAGHGKMRIGTGDTPMTVSFYESCGFVYSHRIKDYMLEHYDHPIFEDGVQLRDKVYFAKEL